MLISATAVTALKGKRSFAHFGGRATKACPDWAERVLEAARVCRFCGYRFRTRSQRGKRGGNGRANGFETAAALGEFG